MLKFYLPLILPEEQMDFKLKKGLVTANDSDSSDSCSSHPMSSGEEDISDATTSDDKVYQDVIPPDSIKKGILH